MSQLSFDDLPAEPEPEPQPDPADHLYVIGEGSGSGVVKIGRAANVRKRLYGIQVGNPRLLKILHVEEGAGDLEFQVHGFFRTERLQGEWFDLGAREPAAEVKRALEKIRAGVRPVPAKWRSSDGLKRSPWFSALILARRKAPGDILDAIGVAAHMLTLPTEELRRWPESGASIPMEWNGADLVIRRRDLEDWARRAPEDEMAAEGADPAA